MKSQGGLKREVRGGMTKSERGYLITPNKKGTSFSKNKESWGKHIKATILWGLTWKRGENRTTRNVRDGLANHQRTKGSFWETDNVNRFCLRGDSKSKVRREGSMRDLLNKNMYEIRGKRQDCLLTTWGGAHRNRCYTQERSDSTELHSKGKRGGGGQQHSESRRNDLKKDQKKEKLRKEDDTETRSWRAEKRESSGLKERSWILSRLRVKKRGLRL